MLFLLNRFFGGRYGPLLRAGLGVVLVVLGLALSSKVLLLIGAVFVLWGLVTGVGAWTNRGRRPPTQSSRDDHTEADR